MKSLRVTISKFFSCACRPLFPKGPFSCFMPGEVEFPIFNLSKPITSYALV